MTDDHKQVFLGTLLGNGFICKGTKNSYFSIKHSNRHMPWLQTKVNELQIYSAKKGLTCNEGGCSWRTSADPIFTEMREKYYKDGKKNITMEWLDSMRDIGIAVWYGDSGCLIGRNKRNACLKTQSFGLEGNQIIAQFFNEVGFECNLNKSKKSYVIVFSVTGTEKLFKMISIFLPKNRYYKMI